MKVYIALMRFASAMLLLVTAPLAAAQSPSRDWRPEDRTVIGNFSRITAIATSMERVYVASTTSLAIRHPQFQTWSGPFEPPRRDALAGVFTALVDPLDQSVWLARADGWLHYQPELQLWDEGRVPGGVVAIAFDEADPVGGLYTFEIDIPDDQSPGSYTLTAVLFDLASNRTDAELATITIAP